MKYLITTPKSPISSIEIGEDLSWITFTGDVKKIEALLSFISRFYVRCRIRNEICISGLGDPLIVDTSLVTVTRNYPSIYGGILSLRFILGNVMSRGDPLYHRIITDINLVSATLDKQFFLKKAEFEDLVLSNPMVLPEEKIIVFPDHVESFKGRMVAFKTNISYFKRSKFVSPLDSRYRFALISEKQYPRGSYGDIEFGFDMSCFMSTKDSAIDTPLIKTFLEQGALYMRLATVEELNYLLAANELQQGCFKVCQSTKKIIQTELARLKAPITLLDDADNHLAEVSSSYAASSSSQEPIALPSVEATLPVISPSYLPGYQSTAAPAKQHSDAHHHASKGKQRRGRRK